MESASLRVGDSLKIKKGIVSKSITLQYAGMPSSDAFSIAISWTSGNNSAGYNLFFPKETRGFDLLELGHVTVQEVTPERFRFVWERGK